MLSVEKIGTDRNVRPTKCSSERAASSFAATGLIVRTAPSYSL